MMILHRLQRQRVCASRRHRRLGVIWKRPPTEAALLARPSSLLSQPALFSVSLVCQRLVGQFALRTFKRAPIGTSKAALDTDQHHANLALGAARPLDHARGMRFRHVMHSLGSGGSATLSVTDNSRRRGDDEISYTANMFGI